MAALAPMPAGTSGGPYVRPTIPTLATTSVRTALPPRITTARCSPLLMAQNVSYASGEPRRRDAGQRRRMSRPLAAPQ